jgi:hypothetical protein
VIGRVPEYHWRHGSGPTAAGMVIGYWDARGFSALIPGDASEQSDNPCIDQAIATGDEGATHHSDYSLPIDDPNNGLDPLPDLSEPPPGDEHASNCIADFMMTSWSAAGNFYGWSWSSDVDDAFIGYTSYVNATYGANYEATSWREPWGEFTWERFVAEIDAGRPMVILVDAVPPYGEADHFVTAIGYRDTNGYPEYACFDTWPVGGPHHGYRWERFRSVSTSYGWGVFAATYFSIEAAWHETTKLLPGDGARGDFFGQSVCVSGDTAVIGAYGDDDNGDRSGSAYVFRYDGTDWVQEAKLLPDDGAGYDYFGCAVSLSGDIALIGAYGDDDQAYRCGSAYVFRYDGTAWVQEAKLLPDDGAEDDYFGHAVSLSGDAALIGAYANDDYGSFTGSAYVYRYDGTAWVQEAKLLPDEAAEDDHLGYAVSICGDTALIGAYGDCDHGGYAGSTYAYRYNGLTWVQEAKLLASDGVPFDHFGCSTSLSGNTAVIGAAVSSDSGWASGSAYVFRREGSTWLEQAKLLASDGTQHDMFGWSVSASGDVALIGTAGDGDAAYVFRCGGSTWVEEAKLLASDGTDPGQFGYSVSVSGDVALIGRDEDDENGTASGSAYVFEFTAGSGAEPDCPGDLDGDGGIDLFDLAALLAHCGTTGGVCYEDGDIDLDGDVDLDDLSTLLAVYGTTCP